MQPMAAIQLLHGDSGTTDMGVMGGYFYTWFKLLVKSLRNVVFVKPQECRIRIYKRVIVC